MIKIVAQFCTRLFSSVANFPSGIRAFIKMLAENEASKNNKAVDYQQIFTFLASIIIPEWLETGFEFPEIYGLNPVPKHFTSQVRKTIFTTARTILNKIFTFSKIESLPVNPELFDMSLINRFIKS